MKKINKKAQMKIQQMTFMLIAVTLFFVLAGLFALSLIFSNVRQSATTSEEENALLIISKLDDYPELSCGEVFSAMSTSSGVSCIDADKAMVVSRHKNDYLGFWRVVNIKLIKVYPTTTSGNVTCTNSNYPNCDVIDVYSRNAVSGEFKSSFVSLCRKEAFQGESYDKCEIARVLVSYEVTG